ncbi:MAG: Ig-like domain-containing protein [Armatimonadota bacterium]
MFPYKARTLLVLAVALALSGATVAYGQTQVIRNGSFEAGMDGWMVSPDLFPWNPLQSADDNRFVTLTPPNWSYTGLVLFQNMNVTNVAGKTAVVAVDIQSGGSGPGASIAVWLEYVDPMGKIRRARVFGVENPPSPGWITRQVNYDIPSDAVKIIRFGLVREDYGDFQIDNVSMLIPGVTVGTVPAITAVTPPAGPYGTEVTISGSGFGASQGTGSGVEVGGSPQGITVLSWSDTQIRVRISDPASSGAVVVTNGYVAADGVFPFSVTSPHYTVKMQDVQFRVIKGVKERILVRVDFQNGFSTAGGVNFSVPEAPAGVVRFTPVPVKARGGTVLLLDTSSLTPGTYEWTVQATEGTLAPRVIPFTLHVLTISSLDLYESEESNTPLTQIVATAQGKVRLYGRVTASDGMPAEIDEDDVQVTSGNPGVFAVYRDFWEGFQFLAVDNGTTTLTATFPDGYSKQYPVSVTVPDSPKILAVGVSPPVVDNSGTQTITLFAEGATPLGGVSWDIPIDGWPEGEFYDGGRRYSGTAKLQEGCNPGTYFVSSGNPYGSPYRVGALQVVNAPTRGMIKGKAFAMDSGGPPEVFGTLELYSAPGVIAQTVEIWGFESGGGFTASYIQPGTYRLRFVPSYGQSPQWYALADSYEDAVPVTVTAGGVVEDIYFFLFNEPAHPPTVVATTPPSGATFAGVTDPIVVTFSRPMDPSSLQPGSFELRNSQGQPVEGDVQLSFNELVFTPAYALASGAWYTATVKQGLKSEDGLELQQDYVWQFRTGSNRAGELKGLEDGSYVSLSGKALYKIGAGFAYIEEPDRSSGIRLEGFITGNETSLINVRGILQTSAGGERSIRVDAYNIVGTITVEPVFVNQRNLAGAMLDGIYVRAAGQVLAEGLSEYEFLMTDGASVPPVRVKTDLPHGLSAGSYVHVRGAAGRDGDRVIYATQVQTLEL